MSSRFLPLIILFVCFFSLAGASDLLPAMKSHVFQIIEQPGQASRLVFSDGREATLMMTDRPRTQISVQMTGQENNCYPKARPMDCQYHAELKNDHISLVWTKHPVPEKIGKAIAYSNSDFILFESASVFTYFSNRYISDSAYHVASDFISCKDYGWLTGADGDLPPGRATIDYWSSESMLSNSDTGVSENRTAMSVSQVQLRSWSQAGLLGLQIEAFGIYQTYLVLFGVYPPILQNSMIIKTKDDGTQCQISTSNNFSEAQKAIQQAEGLPRIMVKPAPSSFRLSMGLNYKTLLSLQKNGTLEDFK